MIQVFNYSIFEATPIIGIVRNIPQHTVLEILPRYLAAGLTTIEITMNSPEALSIIRQAVKYFGKTLNIGAGTVCQTSELDAALDAGAAFIVTPIIDSDVVLRCKQHGVPIFPGATTPTEVYHAWKLGATMVKLFPAESLGAKYIQSLRGPFPHIPLLATGGINIDHLQGYWSAGVEGFGIGSPLFPSKLVKERDWQALEKHFVAYASRMKELVSSGKEKIGI
ncbi:bifunctional 4-hydroxy-2-oxoglutarate aldolase/2-dehydro-3-deoxy-phosphogluconate aldolase [Parapedobacter sp. 2B3]|uniref:bifunctional 4-hydroxy-2-oxoglutarate aldolase/2-dehydro-3-deoxy-phosphogluconate aldolase n=1 Tax=Parapedobacter sp. 2B3 TaxID=3342381 RepID=UPI0035B65C4D